MQEPLNITIGRLRKQSLSYLGEGFSERIDTIETEFLYMSDYMLRGIDDPHRSELYADLRKRLNNIAYDLSVRSTTMENPYVKAWHGTLNSRETSAEAIQTSLFEANDPKLHHETLYFAFMALVASYHWNRQTCEEWCAFLTSRQVNVYDQATLVSAITLSCIENFDTQKALCLANTFAGNTTEMVRQRALIGCLLALSRIHEDKHRAVRQPILDILELRKNEGTIIELFMQMVTCANADKDSNEINSSIMPEILRHQPFEIKNGRIVEKENTEDDNGEDSSIDNMEKGVEKILNMQKNGVDIFFAGFKQMKRLPFFQKYVNWFIPFMKDHPDISGETQEIAKSKFVERVTEHGPFCESDKYSFVIGIATAMSNVPANIREMMENGEVGPLGMHKDDEDMQKPSLLRLQYLQDLYRFYQLCPLARQMNNPFAELHRCNIGLATITHISDAEKKNLCSYLLKKDKDMAVRGAVSKILNRFDSHDSFDRQYCHAELKLLSNDYSVAIALYNKCLELKPNNLSCLRNLAKAYYQSKDYEKAAFYYDALRTLQPDRSSHIINYALAMTMAGKASQVVSDLYKLDFEQPDNLNIMNVLLWALLYAEKAEQALNTAIRMSKHERASRDFSLVLNMAYAYMANGKTCDGIRLLKEYGATLTEEEHESYPTLLFQSMCEDKELLRLYGIEEPEIAIINQNSTT